jgi:hypothetical protein
MGKYSTDFVVNFLFRPIGMEAAQECRLVPPHRPVKPMRRLPALLRRHAPKHFDLLRTCFFIRQHGKIVRRKFAPGKPVLWQNPWRIRLLKLLNGLLKKTTELERVPSRF